jgi:hypothetical protein
MDDLIVFFGEAFNKVPGQDRGSRMEVARDGGSTPGHQWRSRAMEAPLLGRNELPQRSRGSGGIERRSHQRVTELATEASLPPSSPPLPPHQSPAHVVEPRSSRRRASPLRHHGGPVTAPPGCVRQAQAPPLPLCDASDGRI